MDYEFDSQLELFKRVRPALSAKKIECHRLGFSNIKDTDIWNYLIESKWKKGKNLMLSDIVSDIMHSDCKRIDLFLRGENIKNRRSQDFDDNNEIL